VAAEAQACQAVLGLDRDRVVLLLSSVLGRYGPGGVRLLGAGPLIALGRDYPGAFRCGGLIVRGQVLRGGRLVASGLVRLVPGRDG
jgi:hypothetical protein